MIDKQNNSLITIIVPVYNVENYLCKCVDSILAQTYKNLEIILVDDGSPDGCPQICDEYAQKDNRIKVIHKENGGLSDARNAGLDAAHGKYVSFIDSDDTINEKMIELLYDSIIKNKSNVSLCKINILYPSGEIILADEINLKLLSNKSIASLFVDSNVWYENGQMKLSGLTWSVCRALYSRNLIDKTRFIKDMISEDFFFNIEVLEKSKKISIVDKGLYNYYQRGNSIVRSYSKEKLFKRICFSKEASNFVKNKVETIDYSAFMFSLYESCVLECVQTKNYKELFNSIKNDSFLNSINTYKNCKARMKQLSSIKKKMACLLLYFKMFGLYRKLYLKHKTKH